DAAADLFGGLRWVIVDEVHALAAGKRGADLALSLERLELVSGGVVSGEWCNRPPTPHPSPLTTHLQRIGLSATSTPLSEAARFLVGVGRPCVLASIGDAAHLELTLRPLPPGRGFVRTLADEVLPELATQSSTLIFTNTRGLAERLAWALRRRMPA